MTPDKVEAALAAELCVLNHCTEPCAFHRRWAIRLAGVISSALAESERDAAPAYEAGWRNCAKWADRNDLYADIGSPAYIRDRDAAMKDTDHAR